MISPTVGRVVWFYNHVAGNYHQGPLAAHVCKVHSDTCVNLMVITESGTTIPELSVPLLQDEDKPPEAGNYCCWMPYQKGQAAKTEAAEAAHKPAHHEKKEKP